MNEIKKDWEIDQIKNAHNINIRMVVEKTDYSTILISKIVNTSKLDKRIDFALEACNCLLANLYYAYLMDKPVAIQLTKKFWSCAKKLGYEWATYPRIKELLDTMEILDIIKVMRGFYSRDKKYCSKYWLNPNPDLPSSDLELSLCDRKNCLQISGGVHLQNVAKNIKNRDQKNFINKYNKMIQKQDISFLIKIGDLSSDGTSQKLLSSFLPVASKINLNIIQCSINGTIIKQALVKTINNKPYSIQLILDKKRLVEYRYNNNKYTDNDNKYTGNIHINTNKVVTIPLLTLNNDNVMKYKEIVLSGICIDASTYRRFCCGSEKLGGRFYSSSYSNLPKPIRKSFKINDELTCEPDYSGMHIRLLYAMEGIDYRGECYVYDKEDIVHIVERDIFKRASLIMINSKKKRFSGKTRAKYAILNKLFSGDKTKEKEVESLMNSFEDFHTPIKKYLYSNIGIELQFKESEIMLGILKYMTNNNIIALSVHDSVIIQQKYKEELVQVMSDEYEKIMKFKPVIT